MPYRVLNTVIHYFVIQGGAELTDTFQMFIDNVWKRKNKRNRL